MELKYGPLKLDLPQEVEESLVVSQEVTVPSNLATSVEIKSQPAEVQ